MADQYGDVLPLDKPMPKPEKVFHPEQVEFTRNKDTGDYKFKRAKGTAENLRRMIRVYGIGLRYNALARDIEVFRNGKKLEGELHRNAALSMIEDVCRLNNYPATVAASHMERIAAANAYCPASRWIATRPWDGRSHIEALFRCLELVNPAQEEISQALFVKWFLGAVAILTGHTNKFEHVLVLVDDKGGIGKTRFFNTLCLSEFQADGVILDPENKDSVMLVCSKWLVELGEIDATMRKSDREALKAFLSRDSDEIRPPYARASNKYRRRTAFFGSVNSIQFLNDDTTNRRFWPIHVKAVDYQHGIDMQQVWAEALHRVKAGEAWHLTPEESHQIGAHNEAFKARDRVEELILSHYDPGGSLCRYLSASQVLAEVGIASPRTHDTRKAGAILRKLFSHKIRRGLTVFHMPQMLIGSTRLASVGGFRDDDQEAF